MKFCLNIMNDVLTICGEVLILALQSFMGC